MKILFVGDIVGKGGRRAVAREVPGLLDAYGCSFCVANGENMAGGGGFTRRCVEELDGAGVDVFTGGDHMWDQRDFVKEVDDLPHVLRPANVCERQPGRGWGVFPAGDGQPVGVLCLQGRTFMNASADCPFRWADRAVKELRKETSCIVVDMHAEATSEKIAMGRYLDGRVSAVFGTHTHVPTADEQVFPGGTAFLCDVGMVGARESILGRAIEPVLQKFSTGMPARFKVVDRGVRLHGVVVTLDGNGRAQSVERVVRDGP